MKKTQKITNEELFNNFNMVYIQDYILSDSQVSKIIEIAKELEGGKFYKKILNMLTKEQELNDENGFKIYEIYKNKDWFVDNSSDLCKSVTFSEVSLSKIIKDGKMIIPTFLLQKNLTSDMKRKIENYKIS